ncbi:PREDICTED: receptor expression-enhancing protein 5-like [Diuraphis noxia]|uniref:receptor expression-enhancing protein 5-like n=1 Tax=Diuraphis noxia TaxID=143948 RepID=UPI0007637B60|nr:PREDICTED: receptor expression-enhancing protein 5-like [Diuraphis noxia]
MALINVYNTIDSALQDRTRSWTAPFVWLEGRTGISHVKLFLGCMLTALAFVIASGRMVMLVSNLLGFAYPMYATIELMMRDDIRGETPSPPVPAEQHGRGAPVSPATRWLTYWITFAAVLIVQQLCGDVLQIIPFYFLAKIVFFAWCALPMEANGATFVHRFIVRDYLKQFFI